MIGVIANPSDHAVIREFFELFKTPWEFFRSGRRYDVLLCAGDVVLPEVAAKLVLIYGGRPLPSDAESDIGFQPSKACTLSHNGTRIPVYGDSITFRHSPGVLVDERSRESAMCSRRSADRTLIRIGYSLFEEVRVLLTAGQPVINAAIPALDLHIALLRDLIVAEGIPLVEIPPVPHGYRFLACLTHDVDHPLLREHRFDHTMWGFLYRAILGSIAGMFRKRMRLRDLLNNWAAALKLPFVHLGLSKDFWNDFGRRYLHIEKRFRSSFFVIPFRNRPGRMVQGPAPGTRGVCYGAADIAAQIRELQAAGCEIGLHGIDAWMDTSRSREELQEIGRITGARAVGVRMHWLYFNDRSAAVLDAAGADYDSTSGYNETVGYRAGTAQVYKPLEAARLLELPLHVMDTALFFPSHLDLSPEGAARRVGPIIDHAVQSGGCITVNWHDRSIAPERLWGDLYAHLLAELENRGAWFATAAQAVAWFRRRRSAVFETVSSESGSVRVRITAETGDDLPDLQLRFYNGSESGRSIPLAALASGRETSVAVS